MMDESQFNALVDRIMRLGYDEDTAADYAVIIGDTPETDAAGRTIVRDESGQVLATLALDAPAATD